MKSNSKTLVGTSILAAAAASLCCISPILAFIAGVGGLTTAFSWLEPFRPFLVGTTFLALGLAWYQKLKIVKEVSCTCATDKKNSFLQSNVLLGIISIFSLVMLTFPSYAHIFYPENKNQTAIVIGKSSKKEEFTINGMTCRGCEKHVENKVNKLSGIVRVKASYDKANTIVEFDPGKISVRDIQKAIDSTGYKAVSHKPIY